MKKQSIKVFCALIFIYMFAALQACGSDVGGNEDRTAGTVTLTSLDAGGEIVGTFNITWDNDEPNRSFVDIELSSDSGETWLTLPAPEPNEANEICVPDLETIAAALAAAGEDPDAIAAVDTTVEICAPNSRFTPDFGVYVWATNTVLDCRACRIRITATDVVGNVSESVASAEDFIINNVPQVLGAASYKDIGDDGVGGGDRITIPFDKPIELNVSVAGDTFFTPVIGDGVGAFSTMKLGATPNEVIITINDLGLGSNFHLHIAGIFDATKTGRTASSGLDILDNLAGEIIFSRDTGRTAEPIGGGIDIVPSFGTQQDLGLSGNMRDTALVDVNSDGTLDFIAVVASAGTQFVYSNNGAGVFTAIGTQVLGTNQFATVAVGDIDGNGSPDLVMGSGNAGVNNRVFINNGSGTFAFGQLVGLDNTEAMVLGDIDGDEDLDLIVGNELGEANRVWINTAGVFSEGGSPQALGTSDTNAVALGDVDGDGDLDLVTGNDNGQANKVWINSSVNSGIFVNSGQILGDSFTEAVVLEDLDNDGDLDIFFGNEGPDFVWLNDGAGNFVDSEQRIRDDGDTRDIAAVDIDEDGDLDIVTADSSAFGGGGRLYFNTGLGVFLDSGEGLGGSSGVIAIATLGDVDSDGDIDLIMDNDTLSRNSLRTPARPILINSDQILPSGDARGLDSGDLDGDGDVDLVIATPTGESMIWLNDGSGALIDTGQTLATGNLRDVVLGDIDGDGDLDLLTGNANIGQENRVFRNNGSAVFSEDATPQLLGTGRARKILLGDVDGDTDLDFIVANDLGAANEIWLNSGLNTGNFVADQTFDTGNTRGIVLANIDGVGGLDLVTGNDGQANQVWLNNGNATNMFVANQALASNNTQTLAVADVDGNGTMDIIAGNDTFQNSVVWLNDGTTSNMFSADQGIPGNTTVAIELADVDGDGDMDLVKGDLGGANTLWLNNGTSSDMFVFDETFSSSNPTFTLLFEDFDADGDPDVMEGAGFGGNRLFLNDY